MIVFEGFPRNKDSQILQDGLRNDSGLDSHEVCKCFIVISTPIRKQPTQDVAMMWNHAVGRRVHQM